MIKKIVLVLFCIALMASTAIAGNTNMTISLGTNGGDAKIYAYPNTGSGKTDYILDGKNFDKTVDNINDGIPDDSDIMDTISEVFVEYDYGENKFVNVPFEDLWPFEAKFRQAMESVFVTWNRFGNYFNQQQEQIQQLQLEIAALQKLHNDEDLCNARLQVAQDENISKVTCGNTTYHAQNENFVGFEK